MNIACQGQFNSEAQRESHDPQKLGRCSFGLCAEEGSRRADRRTAETPELWGGAVTLANGWILQLPEMAAGTSLPITVEAKKLAWRASNAWPIASRATRRRSTRRSRPRPPIPRRSRPCVSSRPGCTALRCDTTDIQDETPFRSYENCDLFLIDAPRALREDHGRPGARDRPRAGPEKSERMKTTILPLNDPDLAQSDLDAVIETLTSPRLSAGPVVEEFEEEFARYLGRKHAIAVSSGTIGLLLTLRALGIGPGDEVVASAHSFRETTHAIALCGRASGLRRHRLLGGHARARKKPKRSSPSRRAPSSRATPMAIRPPGGRCAQLADCEEAPLIEDSTEAIGSIYKGKLVGSFGDCSVFDFSQPGVIACGEGGMIVTDDDDTRLDVAQSTRPPKSRSGLRSCSAPIRPCRRAERYHRGARPRAISAPRTAARAAQARRALVLRICELLRRASRIPISRQMSNEVHWFLYVVHLGTRFSRSSRDSIVEDLQHGKDRGAAPIRIRCICSATISISAIGGAISSSPRRSPIARSRCRSMRI